MYIYICIYIYVAQYRRHLECVLENHEGFEWATWNCKVSSLESNTSPATLAFRDEAASPPTSSSTNSSTARPGSDDSEACDDVSPPLSPLALTHVPLGPRVHRGPCIL